MAEVGPRTGKKNRRVDGLQTSEEVKRDGVKMRTGKKRGSDKKGKGDDEMVW
jgi:hypothetical protein